MSGLIWAGIGKGISDASDSYNKMMLAEIQDRRQSAREEYLLERQTKRDEALLDRQAAAAEAAQQKAIALQRIKEQAEIDKESRLAEDMKKLAPEISMRADGSARQREELRLSDDTKRLGSLSGQVAGSSPSTTPEQFKELMEKNPQYRDIYRQAGYIKDAPTDKTLRMERAADEADAAVEVGAGKTIIDYYAKKRQAVLDQIRLEMTDELKRDQLAQKAEQAQGDRKIRQQNADANTVRANRVPGSGGSSNSGSKAPAARLEAQAETIRKALKDERNPERKKTLQAELDSVIDQMRELRGGTKTAPSTASRPVMSELPKGAVQIGTSNGKPVYQTPDGKKFIAK